MQGIALGHCRKSDGMIFHSPQSKNYTPPPITNSMKVITHLLLLTDTMMREYFLVSTYTIAHLLLKLSWKVLQFLTLHDRIQISQVQ